MEKAAGVDGEETSLNRFQKLAQRRYKLAFVVFAVPLVLALSLIMAVPPVYLSSTTLVVESARLPESVAKATPMSDLETRLAEISQAILTPDRLRALIDRFNLYADPQSSPATAAARMRRDINVEIGTATQLAGRDPLPTIKLSYKGRNRVTVAAVTDALAALYIEKNSDLRRLEISGMAVFLNTELAETREQLNKQEQAVSKFKRHYAAELPEQIEGNRLVLERLGNLLTMNRGKQTVNRESQSRLRAWGRQPVSAGRGSGDTPSLDGDPRNLLRRKTQELAELRRHYTDQHPDVLRMNSEVRQLEREVAVSPSANATDTTSPPLDPARAAEMSVLPQEMAALTEEEARLQSAIAEYQRRIQNAPTREQELQRLTRDYDLTKQQYALLMKQYTDTRLAQGLEQHQRGEQFRVVTPAIPADTPVTPHRMKLTVLALTFAVGLAAVAVVTAEALDHSFHSVSELRAFTTVPVLAGLPVIQTAARRNRQRRHAIGACFAALLLLAVAAVTGSYIGHQNQYVIDRLNRG